MTTTTTGLKVHPINDAELAEVRHRGVDRWGNIPEAFRGDGGEQLRCCLRRARPGEMLWVIAHAPLSVQRPWREVGPVFVHAQPCTSYDANQGLPDLIDGRALVLRSYAPDGAMYYAGNRITHPDDDVGAILEELLANRDILEVHLRNVQAQCFIARVTR